LVTKLVTLRITRVAALLLRTKMRKSSA